MTRVSATCALFCLLLSFVAPRVSLALPADTRPHWIPVGTVSPELERHAIHHREFLQNRSGDVQRAGLQAIRADLDRFGRTDLRIAVVPIVIDMLGMEYTILSVSSAYQVDTPTRMEALVLLADIGGEKARGQLRASVDIDRDSSVRAAAASLLARDPATNPDEDLQAVARTLYRATRSGAREEEVSRLLGAALPLARNAWNPGYPELLQSLSSIVAGPYSSSLRRRAFSMLEELALR